jgi:hypothetical protein
MNTNETLKKILDCLEFTDAPNSTLQFNVNGNPMTLKDISTKENSDVIHIGLTPKLIKAKK